MPCLLSQSYSEGSSWKAYKVIDKLWIGGLTPFLVAGADRWSIDYPFACQTSETGLFKTQLADGIMGLSNAEVCGNNDISLVFGYFSIFPLSVGYPDAHAENQGPDRQ